MASEKLTTAVQTPPVRVDNFSLDDINVSNDFLSVLELISTENRVDAVYFALPPGVL